MQTILYLTDLYYLANGRKYYEEDLYITSRLIDHFNLLIGHPQKVLSYLDCADVIVFRNTGPVMWYKEYFDRFAATVKEKGITTFNSFDGKADMKGKDYLLQLTAEGYPVIPTVDSLEHTAKLGNPDQYIVKLKDGADSIGMRMVNKKELVMTTLVNQLVQPFINFVYEVSFYYLDNQFRYALFAADKTERWALEEYKASEEDLAFAGKFIQWNNITRGIVRVDACRLPDGSLLLVELEDLNPFLSLDVLQPDTRDQFIQEFIAALKAIR